MPEPPPSILVVDPAWLQAVSRFHPSLVIWLARESLHNFRHAAIWRMTLAICFELWIRQPARFVVLDGPDGPVFHVAERFA